jgi:hypothetical protein
MKRAVMWGLATLGMIVLASGSPLGAADDPPANRDSARVGQGFVDEDGDGVCDNCTGVSQGQGRGQGQGQSTGRRQGREGNDPGNGSGDRKAQRDGSGRGQGPGAACDGTGPRGAGRGRRGGGRR